MKSSELITVEKVTFLCPNVGIENLSFIVNRGECAVLLGANGTGKTTTLKLIAGLLRPQNGRVLIHGINIHQAPLLAKQHIGFLPDVLPLYPELTVREYLEFVAKLRQIVKSKQKEAIEQALEITQLIPYAKRLIGILSKGLKQRVGIAQAILHHPTVLLLDEPTQGLDFEQIQSFQAFLREYKKDTAIILSTHYWQEVQAICDQAWYFNTEGIKAYDFHHCPA